MNNFLSCTTTTLFVLLAILSFSSPLKGQSSGQTATIAVTDKEDSVSFLSARTAKEIGMVKVADGGLYLLINVSADNGFFMTFEVLPKFSKKVTLAFTVPEDLAMVGLVLEVPGGNKLSVAKVGSKTR